MRRSTALTFQMIKTSRIPAALKAGLAGLGAAGAFAGLGGLTMYGLTGGPARTEAIGNNEAQQAIADMLAGANQDKNMLARENQALQALVAAPNKIIRRDNERAVAGRDPNDPFQGAGPMVVDTSDIFAAGPAMGREIMRRLSRSTPGSPFNPPINPSATIGTQVAMNDFFDNPFGHFGDTPLSRIRRGVVRDMLQNVAGPKEPNLLISLNAPSPRMRDYIGFSNNVGRAKPNYGI